MKNRFIRGGKIYLASGRSAEAISYVIEVYVEISFFSSSSSSYSYIPLLFDALEILLEYGDSDDDAMEI